MGSYLQKSETKWVTRKKVALMKMMSGGGVARGTGAAVKGTGFKGVY